MNNETYLVGFAERFGIDILIDDEGEFYYMDELCGEMERIYIDKLDIPTVERLTNCKQQYWED